MQSSQRWTFKPFAKHYQGTIHDLESRQHCREGSLPTLTLSAATRYLRPSLGWQQAKSRRNPSSVALKHFRTLNEERNPFCIGQMYPRHFFSLAQLSALLLSKEIKMLMAPSKRGRRKTKCHSPRRTKGWKCNPYFPYYIILFPSMPALFTSFVEILALNDSPLPLLINLLYYYTEQVDENYTFPFFAWENERRRKEEKSSLHQTREQHNNISVQCNNNKMCLTPSTPIGRRATPLT